MDIGASVSHGADVRAEATERLQAPAPGDTRTEMDRVGESDLLARRFSGIKQNEYPKGTPMKIARILVTAAIALAVAGGARAQVHQHDVAADALALATDQARDLTIAGNPASLVIPVHQINTNRTDDGQSFKFPADRPDRTQYNSPSEWPCDDFQGHWGAAGVNPMFQARGEFGVGDMPSHIHLIECLPRYGELRVGQTITVGFTMVIFHAEGVASRPVFGWFKDGNYIAHDVTWAETGSSAPPDLHGDPMGIVMHSGSYQIEVDPTFSLMAHGWYKAHGEYSFVFTNTGFIPELPDSNVILADEPIYSIVDPNAPENEGPSIVVESRPFNFSPPCPAPNCGLATDRFGGQFVVINQFIPTTVPLTHPVSFLLGTQGYGSTILTPDEALLILDADIHHNIDGIREVDFIKSNIPDTNNVVPASLDPAAMCASVPPAAYARNHKFLLARFQPDGEFESAGLIALTLSADCGHLGQTVTVPNLVGQTQDAALTALAGLGLVGQFSTTSSNQPAGIVISQTQPAGTQVPIASTINFVVSSGSQHQIVTTALPVSGKQITIDGIPQPVQICVGDPNVAANCKTF